VRGDYWIKWPEILACVDAAFVIVIGVVARLSLEEKKQHLYSDARFNHIELHSTVIQCQPIFQGMNWQSRFQFIGQNLHWTECNLFYENQKYVESLSNCFER
jgi:hypothetical protein